jgi:hypothetical protein
MESISLMVGVRLFITMEIDMRARGARVARYTAKQIGPKAARAVVPVDLAEMKMTAQVKKVPVEG